MKDKMNIPTDKESWIELAVEACDHAGIKNGSVEIIATWDLQYCANAVYRISGKRYLKMFGPTAVHQFHTERSVLRTLKDHDRIPTPRIIVEGQRNQGHPYLIVTEVPGSTAEKIWDDLSRPNSWQSPGRSGRSQPPSSRPINSPGGALPLFFSHFQCLYFGPILPKKACEPNLSSVRR